MSKYFGLAITLFCVIAAQAQSTISGFVYDESQNPIENVLISIGNQQTHSDHLGSFSFEKIQNGNHELELNAIGYKSHSQEIKTPTQQPIRIQLESDFVVLETTKIIHKHGNQTENSTQISAVELQENFQGSLAQSLENIAGIQAMSIGSGSSKPVIRGLGFNRISVSENGIKQEGQQWGADHGLEINPWNVENIKILKGAATLEFGSDAMGGVIAIDNSIKPKLNSFSGDWKLFGATNNQLLGSYLKIQQRFDSFYYKISTSYSDFGDYRIPTESVIYLNRIIPIHDEILKNTAGNEFSINTQLGYVNENFENTLNLSHFYQKTGFFPGSHGVPDLDRLQDDGNRRNVEFPYQNVNHFKVSNETILRFKPHSLKFLFAYQNNHRQEWSEFHTHYGNFQIPPNINPDLELDFNLSTYDAQINYEHKFSSKNKLKFGVQSQFQHNSIDGYSFLLPEFNKENIAGFVISEFDLNNQWTFNIGARLDYTQLDIQKYFDNSLYQFLISNGHSNANANEIATRSPNINKHFTNLNGSIGILYKSYSNWDLQLNVGSNFRVPTAIELASNGIHHGSFRHEKGNPNLNPEKGITSDLKFTFHPNKWNLIINPYFYYFQNYIFLEPSGAFSPLPHAGQIYQFTESKAMITGIDVSLETDISEKLNVHFSAEYLYNQQISDHNSGNFPLPFSPPFSAFGELKYKLIENQNFVDLVQFKVNSKLVSDQNRTAKNEAQTDGYAVFGLGIQSKLNWSKFQINAQLSVDNLLDTKYYNHMSFYRALEIPEMGRNIRLTLSIPI